MAKKKQTAAYGLRVGHQSPFRRTVDIGDGERVTLVFEPDTPYDLTAQEVAGLKADIDNEIIIPWEDGNRRMRPVPTPTGGNPEAESPREELAALKAENAALQEQLAAATELIDGAGKNEPQE